LSLHTQNFSRLSQIVFEINSSKKTIVHLLCAGLFYETLHEVKFQLRLDIKFKKLLGIGKGETKKPVEFLYEMD
jgi:hypothetical protein